MGLFDGLGDIFDAGPGIRAAGRSRRDFENRTTTGLDLGTGAINTGLGRTEESYAAGLEPLEELYGQGLADTQVYRGALGLLGPEAAEDARRRFQLSPGAALNEESILRNRARIGGVRAGGTQTDLTDYFQANEWTPWLNRLQDRDPGQTARDRASVLARLGEVQYGAGRDKAELYTNAYDRLAQNQANYHQNVFGAQQGAAQNQWGAIGQGLDLATKLIGMI